MEGGSAESRWIVQVQDPHPDQLLPRHPIIRALSVAMVIPVAREMELVRLAAREVGDPVSKTRGVL